MGKLAPLIMALVASLALAPWTIVFAINGAGIEISDWVVDWNDSVLQKALQSVSQSKNVLTEIDLFRFRLSPEGDVIATRPITAKHRELLRVASEKRLRKLGTVVNDTVTSTGRTVKLKDGALVHSILRTIPKQERLIAHIITLARREELDGIDIDFENLDSTDRGVFSQFLVTLGETLHADGKSLVVTAHPQVDSRIRKGSGAQDLRAIAAVADEVRVMAYHYHYANTKPGSAAPIPWVESIIKTAVHTVPPHKLTIAFYVGGWCWRQDARSGKQISFQDAQELANTFGAMIEWDERDQVPFFLASSANNLAQVWFENSHSLLQKIRLIRKHRLRGIALWHLGKEDPTLYGELKLENSLQ